MKTAFKILLKMILWSGSLVIGIGFLLNIYIYFAGKDIPPPDDSDLAIDIPVVPDDENAFVYLIKASQAGCLPEDFNWSPPAPSPDDAIDILARNQAVFYYIQKALDCSHLAPPWEFVVDERPNVRFIRKLLSLDVHQAIAEYNLDKAIQKVSVILTLAHLEEKDSFSIIQYLVACAYLNDGLSDIMIIAQQPYITGEQLQQLEALLHRRSAHEQILHRTLKGEYQLIKTLFNSPLDLSELSETERSLKRFFFAPNATLKDYAQFTRDTLRAIPAPFKDMPTWHESSKHWYSWLIPNAKGRWMFDTLRHSAYTMSCMYIYVQATSTAAETIVALHRYKQQHHVLPDSLEALVPDFLPAVPIDPYNEQPIRYRPEQNIIYFVGENMTDDGGQGEQKVIGHSKHRKEPDIVFAIEAPADQ